MHVVATAGHVDHGKSALVLSLTGIDPDRWPQEKARGLTIDLGFASKVLPSGRLVAFVDVPGHVRFLKNMLAGVGAVDACVFVVAATEGWKPQSEEHLQILELLGVNAGVIALTKSGLVDGNRLEIAQLEVTERVARTFLQAAPIVAVDSIVDSGMSELTNRLDDVLAVTPTAKDSGRPRLWIDRSFAARGAGTVVTGTLTGGDLAVGDEVEVSPSPRPTKRSPRLRVRGLQTHGQLKERVGPGHRLAVNLAGISHNQLNRGQALVRPNQWFLTGIVDATLSVLAKLGHEVSQKGAYLCYVGSGEYPTRLGVIGQVTAIAPGSQGLVRLKLPTFLPLMPGDRYVLRESGRSETVGGGEFLDVNPVLPSSRAKPDRSVDRVIAERGWLEAELSQRLTGVTRPPNVAGRWIVDPSTLAATMRSLRNTVANAGPIGLELRSLSERERAVVMMLDNVRIERDRARLFQFDLHSALSRHPFILALAATPFRPPDPAEVGVDRAQVRELVDHKLVVDVDGYFFLTEAIAAAAGVVARLLVASPLKRGVTVSAVRDALDTTRKYVLPLLSYLDATGVTCRDGDLRVAGPNLPEVERP